MLSRFTFLLFEIGDMYYEASTSAPYPLREIYDAVDEVAGMDYQRNWFREV